MISWNVRQAKGLRHAPHVNVGFWVYTCSKGSLCLFEGLLYLPHKNMREMHLKKTTIKFYPNKIKL